MASERGHGSEKGPRRAEGSGVRRESPQRRLGNKIYKRTRDMISFLAICLY